MSVAAAVALLVLAVPELTSNNMAGFCWQRRLQLQPAMLAKQQCRELLGASRQHWSGPRQQQRLLSKQRSSYQVLTAVKCMCGAGSVLSVNWLAAVISCCAAAACTVVFQLHSLFSWQPYEVMGTQGLAMLHGPSK
jgi:hypothetical protein